MQYCRRSSRGSVDWNLSGLMLLGHFKPSLLSWKRGLKYQFYQILFPHLVAPLVEAWIEISITKSISPSFTSLLSWKRGLKYRPWKAEPRGKTSLLSWKRGLKLRCLNMKMQGESRSSRGSVDWNTLFTERNYVDLRRSSRGSVDWNKIKINIVSTTKSLLSWKRGLKYSQYVLKFPFFSRSSRGSVDWNMVRRIRHIEKPVAPLVEAWIEIAWAFSKSAILVVAPLVEAWIEIIHSFCLAVRIYVAPLVEAWIEISEARSSALSWLMSLLSWKRGLKLKPLQAILRRFLVAPLVEAWIEIQEIKELGKELRMVAPLVEAWIEILQEFRLARWNTSLLSWKRGLK